MALSSLVTRLRDPVYTGPNRCWPCSVANVALVALVAVAAGVVAPAAGVAVGMVGVAAVWLRGYVVPGTPALTRRYLPASVRAWVGKAPTRRPPDAAAPADRLTELGVLRSDGPRLAPGFRDPWGTTASALAGDGRAIRRAAAEALSSPSAGVTLDDGDGGVTLTVDGEWIGQWPSRTALVADLATELTLAGSGWAGLERPERADLAARIRALAERCPVCDAATTVSEDTVDSCCGPTAVVAVTCPGCAVRLAEFDPSPAAFAPGR
jgi:hypothetical protein